MSCGKSKRVLLTGASGLIGKELLRPLLDREFEIYAITIDESNPDNGIHWVKSNLFDEQAVKNIFEQIKPEYLLNMAWITTGDYLNCDMNYDFLKAGINLIKYFKLNGGRRAVYAGTCFEYKFKDEPLKESDALDADKTVYTFCKNKLREICQRFCDDHSISFGYGRIFYVYGKNECKTRLTGMVIDKLSHNQEVVIRSGELYKDYIYAEDIANAFVAFLDSDVEGCVNISTGKAVSIADYVTTLGRMMHKEHLIRFESDCAGQPKIIEGDNSRLRLEVGYTPEYSIEEALASILK